MLCLVFVSCFGPFSCVHFQVRMFFLSDFVLSVVLLMYVCCFQSLPVFSAVGSFEAMVLAAIGLKASPCPNPNSYICKNKNVSVNKHVCL